VHPPALLQEDAAIFRDRLVSVEEMLEHRRAASLGVHTLGHLCELKRVAEQDERVGRRPHGEGVGERDLPGLVDDEHVELPVQLLTRKQPRGTGDELRLGAEDIGQNLRRLDLVTTLVGGVPPLEPREDEPLSPRAHLHLVQQVVDRLVALRGYADLLTGGDQRDDHLRASVRLPRARRALHIEVRAVERDGEGPLLVDPQSLHPSAAEREVAPQDLHSQIGAAVPDRLRSRWTYVRGRVAAAWRRCLPRLATSTCSCTTATTAKEICSTSSSSRGDPCVSADSWSPMTST
jgi:hypothetical protein